MLNVGPFKVDFIRTYRVPEGRETNRLPPGYGSIPVRPVHQYSPACPISWARENSYFMGLHDCEALWLNFQANRGYAKQPLAVLVGAGGINAVNGQPLGTVLEAGNYLVVPPQPWLDGFMCQGMVRQFVATKYQGGFGQTAAEQIMGTASQTGALGFAVFEPIRPLVTEPSPRLTKQYMGPCGQSVGSYGSDNLTYACYSPSKGGAVPMGDASRREAVQEMGLGAGGHIEQKIYPDPYGLHVWRSSPTAIAAVYICSAEDWFQITGQRLPDPVPEIRRMWDQQFSMADGHKGTLPTSCSFEGLHSPTKEPAGAVFPGNTDNLK